MRGAYRVHGDGASAGPKAPDSRDKGIATAESPTVDYRHRWIFPPEDRKVVELAR
jgi:hypothetical protein